MPNTNPTRRVGRPALNNVQRLYDMLAVRYRQNNGGVTINEIATHFSWSEGTVRSMISQVRSQLGVRIRFNRHSNAFRLVALRRENTPAPTPAQNAVVTPAPAQLESAQRDALIAIGFAMNRECETFSPWASANYVHRGRMSHAIYSPELMARIHAIRGDLPQGVSMPGEPPVRDDFRNPPPGCEAFDVLAPIMAVEASISLGSARNWLESRCRPSDYVDVATLNYGGSTPDTIARIRAFVAAERTRRRNSPARTAPADSLWRGIAPEVVSFYRERALDLRA